MDFFDNALNKTKEAFDVVCKKTNEVVSVQKQKFDIASIENKRSKDFELLGKLYFDLIKNEENENEEISALVDAIKEKNAKIKELNDDINNSKNKRICPVCESYIENSALFCSKCGAKLEVESDENV